MHRERSLVRSDTEVLTVGQSGVLRELKLANDNLRWRLQQRNKVLLSNQNLIDALRVSLKASKLELATVTEQRDKFQNKLLALDGSQL